MGGILLCQARDVLAPPGPLTICAATVARCRGSIQSESGRNRAARLRVLDPLTLRRSRKPPSSPIRVVSAESGTPARGRVDVPLSYLSIDGAALRRLTKTVEPASQLTVP
jgi:hypothetical protein